MSHYDHQLRVLTWNIHGFCGDGGRPDPERTLRVIRAIDADIVALQEVDGRTQFGRMAGAFEWLADAMGAHRFEARLLGTPGREYGHLLWSRWPLQHATLHRLPGGWEPRGAIEAQVETPAGRVRVISTHLSLSAGARRLQGSYLADRLQPDERTIVLGDFNEWGHGAVHRRLERHLSLVPAAPTWPSRRPFVALDRIYAGRHLLCRSANVDRAGGLASDHCPLIADFAKAE